MDRDFEVDDLKQKILFLKRPKDHSYFRYMTGIWIGDELNILIMATWVIPTLVGPKKADEIYH